MIIQKNEQIRKGKIRKKPEYKTRPTKTDGTYILYRLKLETENCSSIASKLNCNRDTVRKVICGLRRSRRVEAEIARILGKAEWNDVVIEARLAVANPAYTPTFDDIRIFKERELETFTALVDPQANFAQTRSDIGLDKEAV